MIWLDESNLGERVLVKVGGTVALFALAVCLEMLPAIGAAQSTEQQAVAPMRPPAVRNLPVDPPEAGQRLYSSAAKASQALFAALQNDDQRALLKVLGPGAADILSSGDETEDRIDREQFVQKYLQMHRLLTEPDGLTTLYIGSENWPTPIPLAHRENSWYFDTAAGKGEILYRRVGENELTVIQVCKELVDAQKEYVEQPHDGSSVKQYAQRIMSDPGKHNGLYWQAAPGEAGSPLGPLLAEAESEGYTADATQPHHPFHGYYYLVLKGQGPNAPGGAKSYIVDGKMTGGFAFLAYPAEYRSSGVMTFLVDQDGVVYQKDLGSQTTEIAKSLKSYDRDASWRKAD